MSSIEKQEWITFREASESDIAAVARVFRAARQERMPYLPPLHTPEEDLEFFRDHVFKEDRIFVATDDQQIVGFCAIHGDWLEHLYVLPGRHGRGYWIPAA